MRAASSLVDTWAVCLYVHPHHIMLTLCVDCIRLAVKTEAHSQARHQCRHWARTPSPPTEIASQTPVQSINNLFCAVFRPLETKTMRSQARRRGRRWAPAPSAAGGRRRRPPRCFSSSTSAAPPRPEVIIHAPSRFCRYPRRCHGVDNNATAAPRCRGYMQAAWLQSRILVALMAILPACTERLFQGNHILAL